MPESNTRQRLRREARERQEAWHVCEECHGEPLTPPCHHCDGEGGWYDE